MSTPSTPAASRRFKDLLHRIGEGDEEAAQIVVKEYGAHILRAVRRRMNRNMRDRFDSEDFAQAVWASFFGHLSVVGRIETENELAGFLSRMASNKVIDAGRRQKVRPAKNTGNQGMPEVARDNRTKLSQPTPSQFAVANERWDNLTNTGDDRQQKLLNLLRSGASRAEIAAAMGTTERNLRRILNRIQRNDTGDSDAD